MSNPQTPPLIEFPTDFSIKAMGAKHPDFVKEIVQAVREYAPDTREEDVVLRPSSAGNYVGATLKVYVENQEQLDNVYRALTSHPMVKVVF